MPEPEACVILASTIDIEAIQDLWREYWDSLGFPGDFQGFTEECKSLPGEYAPPRGRLLLALVQGEAAGTAALRPLNGPNCEAKRLYVRAQYRGAGIGTLLLTKLIEAARDAGYHDIYCNTLKSMTSALRLYSQLGFSEVAPYSSHPTPEAIFLRLHL